MSALTKIQKRELAILANRAFARRPRTLDPGATLKSPSAEAAAWRHSEVAKASGKLGLRCCTQLDFAAVKAHFLHLLGEDGQALRFHMRAATEPRRQAEWHLWNACKKWGLSPNYAQEICRRQYGCEIAFASEKQLWSLKFTLDKRGREKMQKAKCKMQNEAPQKISPGDAAEILSTFPAL